MINRMSRITRLFIVLLVVGLGLSACETARERPEEVGPPAPLDAVPDITGTYAVNGFDPLGTEYGGHLTITAGEAENEYDLQWIVTGSIQEGTGVLEGNTLQVNWVYHIDGGEETSQGTAVYTVTVDGVLVGKRTVDGYAGEGTETCFPNE